jgi:hypothetical protein
MHQSPFWEAYSRSACQRFPSVYGTPMFITVFTKSRLWFAILIQINPVHILSFYLLKIQITILAFTSRSSEWTLSFRFHNQNHIRISRLLTRATCPARLIFLDLITVIIFGMKYQWWNSILWNILETHVTSCFLGINILLRTMSSDNLNLFISLKQETTGKISLYIVIFTSSNSRRKYRWLWNDFPYIQISLGNTNVCYY